MLGIIGGSGLAGLAELSDSRRQIVRTPFGDPSCALTMGKLGSKDVVFLARHGYGHTVAPHQINYRANLWALKDVGAEQIVAVATVGGIRADCGPGVLAVPDQLIDYTHGRSATYFDRPDVPVTHIDFTQPYDGAIRARLLAAAKSCSHAVVDGATYGCTQGPRLETAAEIKRLATDGCDLVGMTGMPEAALARELKLPYAVLAVVANHAAGRGDSKTSISLEDIGPVLDKSMAIARQILIALD